MEYNTSLPRGINVERLKVATTPPPEEEKARGIKTVKASDLLKVGGLYRIRGSYEAVWSLSSEADGRRYITRADGETATPERLAVTEDDPTTDSAKAAFKVTADLCTHCEKGEHKECRGNNCPCETCLGKKDAYKVVQAGAVYVAWECDACANPNLTKFGNQYECDECHKRYADVLKTEDQQRQDKRTYTRAEVAEYSPEYAKRMGREGIRIADRSLLQVWDKEAMSPMPFGPATKKEKEKEEQAKSKKDFEHSGAKAVNPWAVCHKSVGPEKSDKFERCVMDVKHKQPTKSD